MKYLAIILMTLISQALTANPILKPDSNLKIETLQNGMTIAAYKNSEPPQRASMRLLIKRGSACETESELGLAHFIEHMAFNGTKNFPSGDMVEYFQRLGMAFGADTNAHTGFRETVYKLDMPNVSDKLVADGLTLLRDYCDSMMFDPKAIESERGVILAEKDSRDTPDYRRTIKEIGHYFKGSIYPKRMPIGEESVIKNLVREDFQKFYRATYRPENAVVVIVGDIDADKILEQAKAVFADFKASEAEANRLENLGKLETSDYEFSYDADSMPVDVVFHSMPNATKSYASVSVSKETLNNPDSIEERTQYYRIRALANAISARYLRVADNPDSKISEGSGGSFEFDSYARTFIFNAEAPVGKSADALEENFRQLLSFGNVSNAEIENAKDKILDSLESEIKGKTTRTNQQLANDIVSSFADGLVFTSPEDDLEIAKSALKDFDAEAASKLLKELFDGGKTKVFLSDTVEEIPEAKLAGISEDAFYKAKTSKYHADIFASSGLVFSKFGQSGKIARKAEIADLGITQIEFENGVRLNLKKTDFAKDEILLKVSFGNGLLDIPLDKPEYFAGTYALICGGTKFQNAGEIKAARFRLKMSLTAGVEGNSFAIGGASTRKDFEQMTKFAATIISDAGFRDDGLESLRKYGQGFYLDCDTSPMSQMKFLTMRMISSPIAQVPGTFQNFEKIGMSELAQWFGPILRNSYMEISLVGDIDEIAAVELVASTFGAMPPREHKKKDPFASLTMKPLGEKFDLSYRTVDEPRSIAAVIWPSCGRENIDKMRSANILGAILDDVLRKDIREGNGKVYSPFAYNNSSNWIKGFGLMSAITFVEPSSNAELITLLEACGNKVANDITDDEFERAKIPLLNGVKANLRKNEYWMGAVLNLSQAQPVNIELARTIEKGYEKVSLKDVRKQAKEIFAQKPYSASIMPKQLK